MSDQESPPANSGGSGKKVVLIGVVLLLLVGIGLIGHHHATRNKRSHEKGALNGEGLYARYCMRCHQADAHGVAGKYPDLLASKLSEEESLANIKTGKDAMPAFGDWFPEDYGLLQTYLQSLKK
jgi:cytochrome c553